MRSIWKYQITTKDEQTIAMPGGAELLTIQMQFDNLCVWALVDPDKPTKERTIRIFGTGHPIDADELRVMRYLGTYQLNGGALVFHAYDKGA